MYTYTYHMRSYDIKHAYIYIHILNIIYTWPYGSGRMALFPTLAGSRHSKSTPAELRPRPCLKYINVYIYIYV